MRIAKEIGLAAEKTAAEFLTQQGLITVAKNYFCKAGEIDLIMQDKDCLVFVEVKARANDEHGNGLESVTKSKQQKIIRAAKLYLLENQLFDKVSCRFDVISTKPNTSLDEIVWIKDAFWVKF